MPSPPEAAVAPGSVRREPEQGACDACLRRTRLLELLAPHVERARYERRLAGLLALADDDLLAAIGGARRDAIGGEAARFEPDAARATAAGSGLGLRCRHDPAYPSRLLETPDAPAILHLAGDPAALPSGEDVMVAVVGARRASPVGLEVARGLGRGLAAAGVRVISGMALGVDSAAHTGALEAGGPTIAVLAGGADRPYPRSKARLHARLRTARGCAVVSEMPPGFVPFRWGFPARNRIIAGLAHMTVVVEAAARSGSLITAEMAQDLGRLVGAVPGSVLNPMAAGTNALLRDGAEPVRDAQDVLDTLLGPGAPSVVAGPPPPAHLRALHGRLGERPTTAAGLVRTGDEADAVVAGLAELELLGLAQRMPGGAWVRGAGRP